MRLRSVILSVALALPVLGVGAFEDSKMPDRDRPPAENTDPVQRPPSSSAPIHFFPLHSGSSLNLAPVWAVNPGAIYELRLRIRWADVEDYLNKYAVWYLPVDQFVCPTADGTPCESSGRKLLSVLSRDLGDHYNIIFLYRYESAYKEDYYCKYDKAFFQYHTGSSKRRSELEKYYDTAVKRLNAKGKDGQPLRLEDLLEAFPAKCSAASYDADTVSVLRVADLTIHLINLDLASKVELNEAAWNFEVSVCKVAEPHAMDEYGPRQEAAKDPCPPERQSLLERAVQKWASNWP